MLPASTALLRRTDPRRFCDAACMIAWTIPTTASMTKTSTKKAPTMAPGLRRLYAPEPVPVDADPDGSPLAVAGVAVVAVRERWEVDDRWWIPERLSREYFELVLVSGRSVVVFRCGLSGRWYRQRA